MESDEALLAAKWESSLYDTSDAGDVTDETAEAVAEEPESPDEPPADEAPADSPDDSPADATDDGEQPSEEDDELAVDEPVAPEAAQPAPEQPPIEKKPFNTRVDGKDLELPGAFEAQGHKVIPNETWQRQIVPRLADRRALMERHKAELDEVRSTKSATEVRAEILLGLVEENLLSSEEKATEFLEDFEKNMKILGLEVESRMSQYERTQAKRQTDTQSTESLLSSVQSGLETGVDMILAEPEFSGLGLDRQEMLATMWDFRLSVVREATDRDEGRVPGEPVIDLAAMRRMLSPAARAALKARSTQTEVNAAETANAASLRRQTAPPAVASRGTPAPGGKAKTAPTNMREWEESVGLS